MSKPLASFRKIIPWYVKFWIKIIRGILPLPYDLFAKLGFFRHGNMDDPRIAIGVFQRHFPQDSIFPKTPFVFLEIGPGDSLFTGIIAASKGAKQSYLVDYGDWVSKDVKKYLKLIEYLYGKEYLLDGSLKTIEDIKKRFNIHHLVHGLSSLKEIPDACVDVSFSNACFEHVYAHEMADYFKELRRVSKPKTFSSHLIDFKDHLAYSLNNLRFSNQFWESDLVKQSGIYTNRLRFSDMKKMAQEAGFKVDIGHLEKWNELPLSRSKIHIDFKNYELEDLLIKEACLRLS